MAISLEQLEQMVKRVKEGRKAPKPLPKSLDGEIPNGTNTPGGGDGKMPRDVGVAESGERVAGTGKGAVIVSQHYPPSY